MPFQQREADWPAAPDNRLAADATSGQQSVVGRASVAGRSKRGRISLSIESAGVWDWSGGPLCMGKTTRARTTPYKNRPPRITLGPGNINGLLLTPTVSGGYM